jgi:hypothetical protein
MTTAPAIRTLFASDIDRRIEEVIKVDQTNEDLIKDEIDEYVVTDAIAHHYTDILELYRDTPNKPHEGIAVWVSGFFGSGKSSFAKMLGLAIANRTIVGEPAAQRFAAQVDDVKLKTLLRLVSEKIPTHAVIFDVSTDRGIRSGNQSLTQIMYGLFLHSLGYAKDLDLSELEIALEKQGRLATFEAAYVRAYGKAWNDAKGQVGFALSHASRVMHDLDSETYPFADSWVKAVKDKADISPGKLAERATELMKLRKPGHNLIFVVDEVGQFVARDVQKMLDLQAVVQNLGAKGRGKHWIVVTSQEKLNELVSGLDDKKIELARLMERFPQQVHLEPSDISEVTSRRVLAKNAAAQTALGKLFEVHRPRLIECTRLTADITLPELTRDGFVDLYPLLPYQIDLIILIVSGLRTQGGASKHVGGANRTIIKLAQQLLINPAVALADAPINALVRLDQVYDLVEGNIGSDLRAKIITIPREVAHPQAQAVAKVICLLQYVKTVHRTPENIAAALYPTLGADSQLATVKDALADLERAHKVRRGDDGYRIPTPAEDDWERSRNAIDPKPGDEHRLTAEVITAFWQPQPTCVLAETKPFRGGLAIHNREAVAGDLVFHVQLADEGADLTALAAELRARSQLERKAVFWAVGLTPAIDRELKELYRSKEILAKKERDTKGGDDAPALLHEERQRQRRHGEELRRLLKAACLSGSVYFQGNDRSPGDSAAEVSKTASEILAAVLPTVFDRYPEAAAKPADVKKGLDALFTADNLNGLPAVFTSLALLRDEKGKPVFDAERGPLREVMGRIEERANYGDTASGRFLADELAKEPFGWDFEVVRLLVLCLVRAGKVEATSKGQTFDTLTGTEAKEAFSNNPSFRQAAFRPKKGIEFEELVKAADAFRDTFGSEVRELNAGAIALELRKAVGRHEETVGQALALLVQHHLPGAGVLDGALGQMKAIVRGSEDGALGVFNASHRSIKDAIKRAAELEQSLSAPRLADLARAKDALTQAWPFLQQEPDVGDELKARAAKLTDLLARETFYKELPAIDQHAHALAAEYERRYQEALAGRVAAYGAAYETLKQVPGWKRQVSGEGPELDESIRVRIEAPFVQLAQDTGARAPIPQLRSERDAAEGRLRAAVAEVRRILEGERLVTVRLAGYFGDGIEEIVQLDAALEGIREECMRLLAAGKKIVIQ